jgi:hypothetical protein
MKYIHLVLLGMIAGFGIPGQSQSVINDPNVQVRNLGSFNAISVSSAIDVYFTQSASTAVAVSASQAGYVDNITTEVRNNTLYIGYRGKSGIGPKYLRAYLSAPEIIKMEASGACNIKLEGRYAGNTLEISLSGSTDFKGEVAVSNLRLSASGSSDFNVTGKAENLRVDLSGSSDLKGFGLTADFADLRASGASDISIMVSKEMKVMASGSSDVTYMGNPIVREFSATGASDIKKRN